MTDIALEVADIQTKIKAAEVAKIRAEASLDAAQAQKDQALTALKDEFGLDNLSDARAKLAELKADLAAKLDQINEILDSIEL